MRSHQGTMKRVWAADMGGSECASLSTTGSDGVAACVTSGAQARINAVSGRIRGVCMGVSSSCWCEIETLRVLYGRES